MTRAIRSRQPVLQATSSLVAGMAALEPALNVRSRVQWDLFARAAGAYKAAHAWRARAVSQASFSRAAGALGMLASAVHVRVAHTGSIVRVAVGRQRANACLAPRAAPCSMSRWRARQPGTAHVQHANFCRTVARTASASAAAVGLQASADRAAMGLGEGALWTLTWRGVTGGARVRASRATQRAVRRGRS